MIGRAVFLDCFGIVTAAADRGCKLRVKLEV